MAEYCENVGLEWGPEQKEFLHEKVRSMGASIINAKGRTHYGIATCVCSLADAVLNQRLTIAPVTSPLQGEYGINDVAISIPSIVGVNGVERRLEERLVLSEIRGLRKSAGKIRETLDSI
jgi:L-lactate dehydrogenase